MGLIKEKLGVLTIVYFWDNTPMMENQMDNKMAHEMETML